MNRPIARLSSTLTLAELEPGRLAHDTLLLHFSFAEVARALHCPQLETSTVLTKKAKFLSHTNVAFFKYVQHCMAMLLLHIEHTYIYIVKHFDHSDMSISDGRESSDLQRGQELTIDQLVESDPGLALQHLLSRIPADSISVVESTACAQHPAQVELYAHIGVGTCGTVYHQTGTTNVLKLAKSKEWGVQLWNDYIIHSEVLAAFHKLGSAINLRIPAVLHFTTRTDTTWWTANLPLFTRETEATDVLASERIIPLPRTIRDSLVNAYCSGDAALKAAARDDRANTACLARVYLGRRRRVRVKPQTYFSLRNFPLHVDQILDIGLEARPWAVAMGKTLAVMHWEVGCDARDVEFVLGCKGTLSAAELRRLPGKTSTRGRVVGFGRRAVDLWMLYFNQVRRMSMDERGVDWAVHAFFENDPYFPRPYAEDSEEQELWTVFEKAYLEMAKRCTQIRTRPALPDLPQMFITKIVGEQQKRLRVIAEIQAGPRSLNEYENGETGGG